MRGMGNMQSMMRQMQKMQKEMQAAQKELYATEFEGKSASDMVTVKFSGEKVMKDIQIKPEAIDPDDPDMLQSISQWPTLTSKRRINLASIHADFRCNPPSSGFCKRRRRG